MKHIFFQTLILVSFLAACTPVPVNIEIAQEEPQLVLASQMLSDKLVLVQVSRSFGALEFSQSNGDELTAEFLDQILADHACVTLSYQGKTDTLTGIGEGFYLAWNTPLYEEESYMLSVYDSITGLQAFAASEVQAKTSWDELSYVFSKTSITLFDTLYEDTTLQLNASFKDLPGENYYMLNAYRISGESGEPGSIFQNNSEPVTRIYSDRLFEGPVIRDTLNYSGFHPGDTVAFAISHISKGYYEFLNTRHRSGTSIFANLLQEPVNYPTNVDGGYGYFNLHLPSVEVRVME